MTGSVPESEMHFSGEPTSDGDNAAEYLRAWYEANRETEKERRKRNWERGIADNLMLGLLNEVSRINAEEARQRAKRNEPETQLQGLIRLRAAVVAAGGPQSRINWIDKGIALELKGAP